MMASPSNRISRGGRDEVTVPGNVSGIDPARLLAYNLIVSLKTKGKNGQVQLTNVRQADVAQR